MTGSIHVGVAIDRKYWVDIVVNYGYLTIWAIVGVSLNFMIIKALGAESLGVFNQIYTIFVIVGQFVVLGLHDSAQKHTAEHFDSPSERSSLSIAAIIPSLAFGSVGAIVLALSSSTIGRLVESESVGRGVLLLSPGVALYSVNKVLMGILNGRCRMVAFALSQSLRALAILLISGLIVYYNKPSYQFGISFTVAEIVLLFFLVVFVKPVQFQAFKVKKAIEWIMRHITFGSQALVHGFLAQAFLRIDIIMLGIFVSDRLVGVYSFISMLVEGTYQVSIVVRTIANPILVRLLLLRDKRSLSRFSRKTALLSFLATTVVSGAVLLIFPYLISLFPGELSASSYTILLILMGGLIVYSVFVPFDNIFLDAGLPGKQSMFMTINTMINVLLNFLLIPRFGLLGACTATTISFLFSCVNLNLFASTLLGLRGGFLLAR